MAFPPRAFGAVAFLLLSGSLAAQQALPPAAAPPAASRPADPDAPTLPGLQGADTTAWLYKGSDITPDPAWKFGTLPSGLRFAVRRNAVPPGQVSIRVRVDAGSLEETEDQRGFAHFIEHLTFRSSRYVADGEAKRVWQRMGTTFGSDTNAQTTPTQTTYKLDLPAASEAGVDESLKILSGMIAAPTITDASVAAERPVVLAEQREQPGPQVRFGDAMRQLFFAGQPLADRSPIGNIKTLEAATGASVKAFHDRWYRPANVVVIVAGDMDPALLARLVVKNFAGWQVAGGTPAQPDFGKPDAAALTSATIAEGGLPPVVTMATLRPWTFNADTVIFNQKRMVDTLAARLIGRRLEQRARAGGSFLQASVSIDDVSRSANLTQVNIVPVGAQWEAALRDVRAVIADAIAAPPTQAEVDREYADYDTALRSEVETQRVTMSTREADDLVEALDIRETVTDAETSYAILKDARARAMFTPATVAASTKAIFEGTATRALVNTQTPDASAAAKLAAALTLDVKGLAGKRRSQAAVGFDSLPALGRPGAVASREPIADLDVTRVTYTNGVRALIFPSTTETGRVYVRVRFGRGYDALPGDRPSAAWAGDLALVASGIGKLDQGDLDALSAGHRIGFDFDIGDDAFVFGATTAPAELTDQLRLFAAKLAHPAWDAAPVERAKAVTLAGYAGFDASPDGVLSRDLERLLRDGDPRWGVPPPDQVRATTARDFRKLWEPLLRTGPIEVSVFGDVTADQAIKAVGDTFGALAPRAAADGPVPPVRFPAHVAEPVTRYHQGNENQAAAVIAWPTGAGVEGTAEARRLDVLAQVFSDRLFERLRQAAGASYSPNVSSQWPIGLPGGGRMIAIGQVAPDKVAFFFQTARAIAAELASAPIPDDELQRIKKPMAQLLLRAATGNQFWLGQLQGASYDPRRIDATRRIGQDFGSVTPADLQAAAAKYLRPETDWTMQVLPKPKG